MSQALIQFLTIAITIAVVIVVALHILKTHKALKEAREFNRKLQGQNARLSIRLGVCENIQKVDSREINNLEGEILNLVTITADLIQEIEDIKAQPLRGLNDADLVEVIREELTHRVEGYYLIDWAYGTSSEGPFWKIASKVGGAAFRVVDKAKRGKLSVQG